MKKLFKTVLQMKLKDFRNSLGLNQTEFAASLGVSQAAIANIENGNREVSKTILYKIKQNHNVDLMSYGEEEETAKTENNSNVIPIPFYSSKAAAGAGEVLPDYPEKDVIYFDERWLKNIRGVNPNNISFIQAKGDSMDGGSYPIKDGDLLMVDESYKEPIHNQTFVVNLGDNEIVVKKISRSWEGEITLESNNPAYPSLIPSEEAFIIGRVVWNGTLRNV